MKKSIMFLILVCLLKNNIYSQENEKVDATTNATHLLKKNNSAVDEKISLTPESLDLSYLSIFLIHIGTFDQHGNASVMATMASNVYNLNHPYLLLNLRQKAKTYQNIINSKAFTLNIPSDDYLVQADYDGHASLNDIEQFDIVDITAEAADSVNAPGVKEFPLYYECSFEKLITIEGRELILGKVRNVKINKNCLKEDKMDLSKVRPILYNHHRARYFSIGKHIGDLRISREIYK
jgi:flavin reductase (DIM6/NTAB) family NADH-FMN oxidoreductase RutF